MFLQISIVLNRVLTQLVLPSRAKALSVVFCREWLTGPSSHITVKNKCLFLKADIIFSKLFVLTRD